jgi:phosphatidate cytidylyltransferase
VAVAAPVYAAAMSRIVAGWRLWAVVLAFPLLAAASLAHIAWWPHGFLWVFLVYATVEVQDSAAFLCGRLFGRRRLAPRLSPRKTLEGALAGAVIALATGTLIAHSLLDQPPAVAIALAAVVTAAGFAGDLFASALKRAAGTKDFRPVHRLHGGLLDIYDSTLFAALPLAVAARLLGAAG